MEMAACVGREWERKMGGIEIVQKAGAREFFGFSCYEKDFCEMCSFSRSYFSSLKMLFLAQLRLLCMRRVRFVVCAVSIRLVDFYAHCEEKKGYFCENFIMYLLAVSWSKEASIDAGWGPS